MPASTTTNPEPMAVSDASQGLAAVGVPGAKGKQTVFFGPHLAGQIVDVAHGVAAGALAHDPGGVVEVLGLGQCNGLAEFLDPLLS